MYIAQLGVWVFWYLIRVFMAYIFWNAFIVEHTTATNISYLTAMICINLLDIISIKLNIPIRDDSMSIN